MEKLRITGLVVLVTSHGTWRCRQPQPCCRHRASAAAAMVPTAAQMLHVPTILLGMLVGGVILTSMAVLSFSAVVKITTENFMAVHAFTPVATLLVQWPAAPPA